VIAIAEGDNTTVSSIAVNGLASYTFLSVSSNYHAFIDNKRWSRRLCLPQASPHTLFNEKIMSYSTDLTEGEWLIIEPLLPRKKKTRTPKWSKREILNGIFYQLKNGCNWCDLPKDLPPYSTVYWHYKQWREQGVIEEIMET
jgi:hypothetical protein